MIKLLDLENDRVVPNMECMTIPELKAVIREYKDPIPALCYLFYKCTPNAAYSHLSEEDKELVLLQDYAGGYSLEDPVMIKAEEKLNLLMLTPTRKYYLNAKKGLDRMGEYLATSEITSGLHGNISAFNNALSKCGQTMEQFKKLEKIYEDETKADIRGNKAIAYDENE